MKKYTRLITPASIKTTVDQQQFPNKKLVATTQVINQNTQQPMPQFKITWIVNGKPHGHKPDLTVDLPKLPKILNVTVVASLPMPEFSRVSTQIYYPQSGESNIESLNQHLMCVPEYDLYEAAFTCTDKKRFLSCLCLHDQRTSSI